MQIRVAEEKDAAALVEIYSYYVEHLNMKHRPQRNLRKEFIT